MCFFLFFCNIFFSRTCFFSGFFSTAVVVGVDERLRMVNVHMKPSSGNYQGHRGGWHLGHFVLMSFVAHAVFFGVFFSCVCLLCLLCFAFLVFFSCVVFVLFAYCIAFCVFFN